MPFPGEPPDIVPEPEDAPGEPRANVEADGSNEEFSSRLEEEKRSVAAGAEPVAVLLDEAHNLALRQAEAAGVSGDRAEHLAERRVADQLIDRDRRF